MKCCGTAYSIKKSLRVGDRSLSCKFTPGLSLSPTFLHNQLVKILTTSVTEECNFYFMYHNWGNVYYNAKKEDCFFFRQGPTLSHWPIISSIM